MRRKLLGLLLGLPIVASSGAHADSKEDATLQGIPMEGPFKTAFDETCAKHVTKTNDDVCSRLLKKKTAELHVIKGMNIQRIYIALQTKDGWFSAALPMLVWLKDSLESKDLTPYAYTATIGTIDLKETTLNGAQIWIAKIPLTWKTSCADCKGTDTADAAYTQTVMQLCGMSREGVPVCTAPLRTDRGTPPGHIVNGRLRLFKTRLGARSDKVDLDYEQELRDGDYNLPF